MMPIMINKSTGREYKLVSISLARVELRKIAPYITEDQIAFVHVSEHIQEKIKAGMPFKPSVKINRPTIKPLFTREKYESMTSFRKGTIDWYCYRGCTWTSLAGINHTTCPSCGAADVYREGNQCQE